MLSKVVVEPVVVDNPPDWKKAGLWGQAWAQPGEDIGATLGPLIWGGGRAGGPTAAV